MPKLLSDFPLVTNKIGSPDDMPSACRPQLALLAMQVISTFALAEAQAGVLFATLMDSERFAGAQAFSAFGNTHAQRKALLAVAQHKLTPDLLELVEIILKAYSAAAEERNPIAHGVWGVCDEWPDAILLGRAGIIPKVMAGVFSKSKADSSFRMEEHVWVYKEIDFINAVKKARLASDLLGTFSSYLLLTQLAPNAPSDDGKAATTLAAQQRLNAIKAEPFIAERLAERQKQRSRP